MKIIKKILVFVVLLSCFSITVLASDTVLQGDVNEDGVVGVIDLVMINNHIKNGNVLNARQFKIADVNKDGVLNNLDLDIIKSGTLKLIELDEMEIDESNSKDPYFMQSSMMKVIEFFGYIVTSLFGEIQKYPYLIAFVWLSVLGVLLFIVIGWIQMMSGDRESFIKTPRYHNIKTPWYHKIRNEKFSDLYKSSSKKKIEMYKKYDKAIKGNRSAPTYTYKGYKEPYKTFKKIEKSYFMDKHYQKKEVAKPKVNIDVEVDD